MGNATRELFTATCDGEGSAPTSALCIIEHRYLRFRTDDGRRLRWFTNRGDIFAGRRYNIRAIISDRNTLQRVKIEMVAA